MIEWRRLVGAVGAEADSVDVGAVEPREVLAALRRHQLLVLRGLELDPAGFAAFARRLGDLDVYPFAEALEGHPHVVRLVKEPADATNFGGAWHTDTAYVARPPAVTMLLAVEVPETGGDTLFADTVGPLAAMSEGFRAALGGLVGCNTASLVHEASGRHAAVVGQSVALKVASVPTEAEHPLVIEDPGTGRRSLYFSLIHTSHFRGMTREESRPLLEQLHDLVTTPEHVTRLRWRPGTLAIWDNRAVQHYPLNDYPGRRREMLRIILKGDRPIGVHPESVGR